MHIKNLAPSARASKACLALLAGISFSTVPTLGEQVAQDIDSSNDVVELDPITVTAHAFGIPTSETGVSVSKIDVKSDIARGIYTADSAIARVPGTYVPRTSGQRGADTQVVLRGLSAPGFKSYNQTIMDGIRIANSYNGNGLFFSNQSIFGFDQIEVVKGSQGALYGGQSISGVIGYELPTGQGKPSYTLFAEEGSFNSSTQVFSAQGEVDKLAYYFVIGHDTTDNDPQFTKQGYPYEPDMQANQQFEGAKLVYTINDKSKFTLSFRRSDNSYHYPEWFDSYTTQSWQQDKNHSNQTLISSRYEGEMTRIWSTQVTTGFYRQDVKTFETPSRNEFYKTQFDWKNLFTWNDQFSTTVGTSWDRESYEGTSSFYTPSTKKDIDQIFAFYGEQRYTPIEALDFSTAVRWEHYDNWSSQTTWRGAISWKPEGKSGWTRLFTSAGSGFCAPSFVERYGWGVNWGQNYVGNPNLDPTKSISFDAGIEQQWIQNHTFTITPFLTNVRDLVVTDADYVQRIVSYKNESRVSSYGVEFAFNGDFKDAWNSGYNLSYTTVNAAATTGAYEGKQLRGTAKNVIAGDLHTSPIKEVTVGLGALSSMGRKDSTSSMLDDYCDVRLFVSWKVNENTTIHGRIENLLNDHYRLYNSFDPKYDARGIGYYAGVTITF